jgi:hypothetical protein
VTFEKPPTLNSMPLKTIDLDIVSAHLYVYYITNKLDKKFKYEKRKNPIYLYQICFQVSLVVGHVHGGAAEHVGRSDEAGKADG